MWQVIAAIAVGSAIEAYAQGEAAKAKAAAARRAAELEARDLESAAASGLQAAEHGVMVGRLKGAEVIGQARTVQAASRLEGGEDALRQTAFFTELDAQTAKDNARMTAWGLRRRARYTREVGAAGARAALAEGRAAQYGALISGGTRIAGFASGGGGRPANAGAAFSPGGSHEGWT